MATNNKVHAHWMMAVAVIALGTVTRLAAAQDSQSVTVDVNKCLALEKRDERLACFDAQVEAAQRAAPAQGSAPAAAGAPPVAGAAAAGSTAAAAASNAPAAAAPPPARPSGKSSSAEELEPDVVAKVVGLRETLPNKHVITLDNGQVWRQRQPMQYPLREGMEVHVKETRFGYRLTAPQLRGQIAVEPVE